MGTGSRSEGGVRDSGRRNDKRDLRRGSVREVRGMRLVLAIMGWESVREVIDIVECNGEMIELQSRPHGNRNTIC